MAKNFSRKNKRAGFTLITALAFSLVVGTVLAGVGTVAMSHYGRSRVEGTYANAIALADAGINYEMNWVSKNPADLSGAHQISAGGFTPSTPPIAAIPDGTFTVGVRDWGSNCDGGNWTNPLHDVCIESTGTVGGIKRRVYVRGIHKSVFDEFAIYATTSGTFNGGGSGPNTTHIIGDMGTNGGLTFNGSSGTGMDTGTVYFNGSGAGLDKGTDTGNTATNEDAINFPTVTQWADKTFPGGLTWLAANNNNANIKKLSSTDTSLASEPTVAGITLSDVNTKLVSAGFTVNSRTFADPTNTVPSDTSSLDKKATIPSTSWRFVQPQTTYLQPYGAADQNSNRVYFVPPGDYYFTRLDFKQGTSVVVFLTHLGPVHIWVDNGNNQKDSLNGTFLFTDPSPNKFRIFYNKCNTMDIAGSSVFPGGFYAVNPACDSVKSTQGTPTLNFTGGSEVLGSVIGSYLNLGGSTSIIFPNNAGGDPTDFALWFGFKDHWKEIRYDTDSAPVFADGTSN